MDKEELVEINFSDIEEEMRKYNKNFEKISLKKISQNLNDYQLFSTLLDDHFTVLVRCASKSAIKKAKDFLTKSGFVTIGSLDLYGFWNVKQDYLINKKLPLDIVNSTMEKVASYLKIDPNKNQEIGKNKEGDYYFYFYPVKEGVPTWVKFKQGPYLDELNKFAKEAKQSIDLIFAQMDNVVYGGLKIPGIASEEYQNAFFEAVNVQVNKSDKRSLYIAVKNILQLVDDESELSQLGLFQMFLVEKEIFVDYEYEEIYLDFPNEVDDAVYQKL